MIFLKMMSNLNHIIITGLLQKQHSLKEVKHLQKHLCRGIIFQLLHYKEFDAGIMKKGLTILKTISLPVVLKADGLAAGKGVIICKNHIEAWENMN